MANAIALVKKYVDQLDTVYRQSSLTNVLESNSATVRMGTNANEIAVPKMSLDGLADYDRASGYVAGSEDFSWETVKFDYDRGRSFRTCPHREKVV